LVALAAPVVQAQDLGEFTVNCDNGTSFTNGIEFRVNQMRSGFDYTATVIGIGGFDPVLAVLGESGDGLCSDDENGARRYEALLPTTGLVPSSSLSSQITFNHSDSSGFQDISLVVGGYGDQVGEFVLILEGMGITPADNAGDSFSVRITPAMIASGVPLSAYAITRGQSRVDPILSRIDADFNVIEDSRGDAIQCDDAGNPGLCYGSTEPLDEYGVTIATGTLPGWEYDSYLSLDISDVTLNDDPDFNFFNFLVSSYGSSQGQYLLVFHVGTAEVGGDGTKPLRPVGSG
jgi:hypothetical protein